MARLTITVTQRWWLKHYLRGVSIMAWATRREPDWDRVRYWVGKGIRLTVR